MEELTSASSPPPPSGRQSPIPMNNVELAPQRSQSLGSGAGYIVHEGFVPRCICGKFLAFVKHHGLLEHFYYDEEEKSYYYLEDNFYHFYGLLNNLDEGIQQRMTALPRKIRPETQRLEAMTWLERLSYIKNSIAALSTEPRERLRSYRTAKRLIEDWKVAAKAYYIERIIVEDEEPSLDQKLERLASNPLVTPVVRESCLGSLIRHVKRQRWLVEGTERSWEGNSAASPGT